MFSIIECVVCSDKFIVGTDEYKKGDIVSVNEPDAFFHCTATGRLAVTKPQVIRGTRLIPPEWFMKKKEETPKSVSKGKSKKDA